MQSVTTPSKWLVTLTDESTVEVWADGYNDEGGTVVFSILVDANAAEQEAVEVAARTPTRPDRVVVTVGRFPSTAVRGVVSA